MYILGSMVYPIPFGSIVALCCLSWGLIAFAGVILASGNGVAMAFCVLAVGMGMGTSASPAMAANVLWTFVIGTQRHSLDCPHYLDARSILP